MTQAETPAAGRRGKLVLQMVLGAISGAGGMMAVMWLLEEQNLPEPSPSTIIAAGVALIYVLMAALVGLGALFPAAGTKLLNVYDRDDLMDQRPLLVGSAIACALIGGSMMLLVFASIGNAPVGPQTAFWLFAGTFVVTSLITWRQWPLYDELMRAVVQETAALFGYGVFLVISLWAAAQAADLATGPTPLDLLSLMLGGFLVATSIVVARRGMMKLD